jgi:hypothetical protein
MKRAEEEVSAKEPLLTVGQEGAQSIYRASTRRQGRETENKLMMPPGFSSATHLSCSPELGGLKNT